MTAKSNADRAVLVEDVIADFIGHSPESTLQGAVQGKAFQIPLVGFSRGDDTIYDSFKEYVGDFHCIPLEIFTLTFPGIAVKAEELAVISWILAQTRATRTDNDRQTTYPAER